MKDAPAGTAPTAIAAAGHRGRVVTRDVTPGTLGGVFAPLGVSGVDAPQRRGDDRRHRWREDHHHGKHPSQRHGAGAAGAARWEDQA
jgi:hypothetical protein